MILRKEKPDYINAAFLKVKYIVSLGCALLLLSSNLAVPYKKHTGSKYVYYFIQGYKQDKAFIVAQSPMQNTVRDFWKMMVDRQCACVVMLCELEEGGQVSHTCVVCAEVHIWYCPSATSHSFACAILLEILKITD